MVRQNVAVPVLDKPAPMTCILREGSTGLDAGRPIVNDVRESLFLFKLYKIRSLG